MQDVQKQWVENSWCGWWELWKRRKQFATSLECLKEHGNFFVAANHVLMLEAEILNTCF